MPAKLSTHVLDTYHGCPASSMRWSLLRYSGTEGWKTLFSGQTNDDGRTGHVLLEGDALKTGAYRFLFEVGAYFRSKNVNLPNPAFLETVIIDVNLVEGESYHVPLLTSPWSYSTYRGS